MGQLPGKQRVLLPGRQHKNLSVDETLQLIPLVVKPTPGKRLCSSRIPARAVGGFLSVGLIQSFILCRACLAIDITLDALVSSLGVILSRRDAAIVSRFG